VLLLHCLFYAYLRSREAVLLLVPHCLHAVIFWLSSALQVGESRRKVDMLREAAQGGLGLGSGGKAARGQQVRSVTTKL
jgi:hypothetical protein